MEPCCVEGASHTTEAHTIISTLETFPPGRWYHVAASVAVAAAVGVERVLDELLHGLRECRNRLQAAQLGDVVRLERNAEPVGDENGYIKSSVLLMVWGVIYM